MGDDANPHAANDDTATKPVMEFLSSGEGLQLTLAFMRIKDGKVRKRVIDLIKSLAEGVESTPDTR